MWSWLRDGSKSKANVSASEQEARARAEAAQQIWAKQSKLDVAQKAIMTQDLAELAAADRAKVREMEQKLHGQSISPRTEESVGDIIVCDDYTVQRGSPGGPRWTILGILLGVALLVAAAAALWWHSWFSKSLAPGMPPAAARHAQEWWEIRERQGIDGKWQETGRVKLRARPDGSVAEIK